MNRASRARDTSSATRGPAPGQLDRIDAGTWRLCCVIVLGAFASGLDASIVNVGLEAIRHSLSTDLSTVQWVASVYLVGMAVSLPLAGWLARRFGSRRVWLTALAAFTLASVLCALAPSVEMLIAARAAQGLAGGVLIPSGQTILGQAVGPDRLGRVMGTLGVAVSAAPALGFLVGGLVLRAAPWPWLFAINVPIGILGLALGRRLIPRLGRATVAPLHVSGLLAITIGLPALVLAATLWAERGRLSLDVVVPAGIAIVALTLFVGISSRTDHPVLNLGLFRVGAFRAGATMAFFSGVLVFASGILFALYFQIGREQSALGSAISLLGMSGATCVTAPLVGRWVDRSGPARVATVGAALAVGTTVPFTVLALDAPWWAIHPLLVGFGIAVGLVAMPAGIAAYRAVERVQLPDAITQINILQRVGGALGGAMCAALVASRPTDPAAAFHVGALPLVVAALGCAVGAGLLRRHR